jgi:hypothetical protein
MESSSSSEEPYIDSFFLPEGILDSEYDDANALLQLTKDRLDGSGGDEDVALTPVAELMPSFLGINKVSWTAPPLLIPSQTADDIVVFYHSAADDLESRSSTHSPSLKSTPTPLLSALQQQEEDNCSDEFRDCISHEKSTERKSSLRVTSLVFTPVADRISSRRTSVPASPPPGFDSNTQSGSPNKSPGSPKAVALPERARKGPGTGTVVEASARQRSTGPSAQVPKKSLSISSQPPPHRREATRGNNRKQSYASVVVAEAKKGGVRDGIARQQSHPNGTDASAPSSSSVAAPLYATPPRTSVGVSIRSADRRHRSLASTSAASASSAGGTERSQSVDGTRPTGKDPSTPSKAARQRNHRRQRKPKVSAAHDQPARGGCGERDSSDSLRLQPQQPISNDSSTSSSSLS